MIAAFAALTDPKLTPVTGTEENAGHRRAGESAANARVTRIITRLNIGGPSIQAISLSRELRTAGFDTCLIHGHLGDAEGDMTKLIPLGDTTTVYLDALMRPVSPLRDVKAFWQIYRALRRWRPAIVHTHTAKAGALGRLAAVAYNWTRGSARRARLVHTYHGHIFEGYFGSLSTMVFLGVERWLAKRTDALIAISPQVRYDLTHTYGVADEQVVSVIPLGFDLDRLLAIGPEQRAAARRALDIPADRFVVSTVGRLTAIKQHTLFLEAAERLAARCDRALFLIAGDGELRGELEALARRKGIESRVRFLGWRGDLETIYGATDVFMLTSRNEGTPVALIEAMASGIAAVSTDVGGVRDVIADTSLGALVPFGDPEALADAVASYLRSPALHDTTGRSARAAVARKFDSRRLLDDIAGLYQRLLILPE